MNVVDLLTDTPEHHARGRHVAGVAVGIVTNNSDPQGLGRVRVKLPWASEDTESDWARVVSFMSGGGRGAVFLPEVDDEVLVAFEHGDVNFPVILGGLWNQRDTPPEKNADGKNNIRKIRSRSGHEIVFQDDKDGGQERLQIRSSGGHTIVLNDATGGEQVLIQDKSGRNLVKIDSNANSVSIESGMKLTLKSQLIEIEAEGTLTLKGAMIQMN